MYQNYLNKPTGFMPTTTASTGFGGGPVQESVSSSGRRSRDMDHSSRNRSRAPLRHNTPQGQVTSSASSTQPFTSPSPNFGVPTSECITRQQTSYASEVNTPMVTGSNLFGQPSTSGIFGSGNAFGQSKSMCAFGAPPPNQSHMFGQQVPTQQQSAPSLFQSNPPNVFGSGSNAFGSQIQPGTVVKFSPVLGTDTMQKNGVTQSISTKHHCITCMKEYENKSLEELHYEDYSANRKGPQQPAGFAPFGGPAAAQPAMFGQPDPKAAFGQPTGFGQAFGQAPPTGFGSQPAAPSMFGKPAFGAPASSIPTFGFGSPAAAATSPFNAKPFAQPLFSSGAQVQPAFGAGVFGHTNSQNANLFQKPPAAFNAAPAAFSFSQPAGAPVLFQPPKSNAGFGMFGQGGAPQFGQPQQPAFGAAGFGAKPAVNTFGTTLPPPLMFGGVAAAKPPMFGGVAAAKPAGMFGSAAPTTGQNMFVFQPPPASSFSHNTQQQQQQQLLFPPEPSDDLRNISLIATDSFPDGPFVYGLDPILSAPSNSTTSPSDIKSVLDYSKQRESMAGMAPKIKVYQPKPRRDSNYNSEFFQTSQTLRASRKCLVIRKFNNSPNTIYNKYKNELLEEAEESLRKEAPADEFSTARDALTSSEDSSPHCLDNVEHRDFLHGRNIGLRLPLRCNEDSICIDDSAEFPTLGSPHRRSLGIDEADLMVSPGAESVASDVGSGDSAAGVVLTKAEYYMFPPAKDLGQYINDAGDCVVKGLTIGRRGYGNVFFPDPINVTNLNLDEIVHFRHREVIVYPDDATKPPVGEGLNRPAQVTLDKIFPREKVSGFYITDVNEIISSNFVDNLIQVTQKHNCKFVDYRPNTGSWVFKVKHFSKYCFKDHNPGGAARRKENPGGE